MNGNDFSAQLGDPSAHDKEKGYYSSTSAIRSSKKKVPLKVGTKAPDFSPVCGDEMALFNEILPEFQKYEAQLLGISVDNVWCHLAFAKDRNLHFSLLSDFHPKGEVSKSYNSYREEDGESERALYLIDDKG